MKVSERFTHFACAHASQPSHPTVDPPVTLLEQTQHGYNSCFCFDSHLFAITLEQCFSNFFTSGRTYEITKALGRITDFCIEKLVIKFENRKMIKKYTEITICLLDIAFYI